MSRKHLLQLVIVLLAGWGISVMLRHVAPVGRDVSRNSTARAVLNDTRSPAQEVPDPTLTMVVFTDYQCPACKLANPAMDAAIAADRHVRVIYRDLPIFGDLSVRAARVAIAAHRQGLYPPVHRDLMNSRRKLDDATIREIAEGAGADWSRIQADLQAQDAAIAEQLLRNRRDASSIGIPGTPAYLIGPILIVGATDEAGFKRAFARARSLGAS